MFPCDSATELIGGFRGAAGDPIHVIRWSTTDDPHGDIVLLHGYGDYSSRYRYFARELNSAGYDVYGIDFGGFGRSGGDRGLISDFESLRSDVATLVRGIADSRPVRPIHTIGHSIGGVIAVSMLSMESCRG
jgi:alpha-beta hydrolase superfamily lysophospholipase